MSHPLYDVTDFKLLDAYRISVAFDDGSINVIDFEPVLHGAMYGPLRNTELFRQVRLNPDTRTLVWHNDADFDPYVLHEWDRAVDNLSQRLQKQGDSV